MRLKFVSVSLLLVVLSCRKEAPTWRSHAFATEDMSRTAVQAHLPRSLWEKITGLVTSGGAGAGAGAEGGHGGAGGGEHGGGEAASAGTALHGPLPSIFAPIRVYLIEKNHGILTRGHTEIVYPAGGGELDLSAFVQPKNGSFYLAVDFLPDLEKADRRVYFLSGAPERVLGGEKYGAGCQTYFDVSSAFQKAMSKDGFLVNTSAGRHVSALAGVYFFAAAVDGKLYLASLTIKDSARRNLQCQH